MSTDKHSDKDIIIIMHTNFSTSPQTGQRASGKPNVYFTRSSFNYRSVLEDEELITRIQTRLFWQKMGRIYVVYQKPSV